MKKKLEQIKNLRTQVTTQREPPKRKSFVHTELGELELTKITKRLQKYQYSGVTNNLNEILHKC